MPHCAGASCVRGRRRLLYELCVRRHVLWACSCRRHVFRHCLESLPRIRVDKQAIPPTSQLCTSGVCVRSHKRRRIIQRRQVAKSTGHPLWVILGGQWHCGTGKNQASVTVSLSRRLSIGLFCPTDEDYRGPKLRSHTIGHTP